MQEETIKEALEIAQGNLEMPEILDLEVISFMEQYLTYWVAERVLNETSEEEEDENDDTFRTAMSAAVVAAYLLGLEDGIRYGEATTSPLNQEIIATLLQKGTVTLSVNIN
jgi:hypothetical protein